MDRTVFMQACRDGGRAAERALRVLHDDYAGALINDAWQSLRNTEQAQDLLQETLLKAWRHCGSFRGDSELFPWLKQVLRHAVIDWLRKRRPESSIDEPGSAAAAQLEDALRAHRDGPDDSPEGQLAQQQLDAVYRQCAERFAAEHPQAAAVIRWIAEDGLSPNEIAQLLQRSPGATREFISQCRKKARHYFHDWYLLAARQPDEIAP